METDGETIRKAGTDFDDVVEVKATSGYLDIMAQQLKFNGCLKIMMEELSTLAYCIISPYKSGFFSS